MSAERERELGHGLHQEQCRDLYDATCMANELQARGIPVSINETEFIVYYWRA